MTETIKNPALIMVIPAALKLKRTPLPFHATTQIPGLAARVAKHIIGRHQAGGLIQSCPQHRRALDIFQERYPSEKHRRTQTIAAVGRQQLPPLRLTAHLWRHNQDHATHCIRSISRTRRTTNDADLSGTKWIDLQSMIWSPFLTLVTDSIVQNQQSPLGVSADQRFGA